MKKITLIIFVLILPLMGCASRPELSKKSYASLQLRVAAQTGNIEEVRSLLASGISVDSVNDEGNTALETAVFLRQLQMIDFLLSQGADINHVNNRGMSILDDTLVDRDKIDMTKLLIERGAN